MTRQRRQSLLLLLCRVIPVSLLLILPSAVLAQCSVSTTPLNFGTYSITSPTPLDSTGTIAIGCAHVSGPRITYNLTIAIAAGAVSGFNPRKLPGPPGETLNYLLSTQANFSTIWGDGTGGSVTVSGSLRTEPPPGNVVFLVPPITVYGRIPALQTPAAGVYSESLVVTLTFNP